MQVDLAIYKQHIMILISILVIIDYDYVYSITTGKPVMGSADVQITLIPPRDVYPYEQFYAMNVYRDPWEHSIYPRLYKHYDYVRFMFIVLCWILGDN